MSSATPTRAKSCALSTPGDWRIRGIGGLFYENYQIQDQVDLFYLTALPYFNPIGPPTGYYTLNGQASAERYPVAFNTPGAVFVPGPPDRRTTRTSGRWAMASLTTSPAVTNRRPLTRPSTSISFRKS